VAISVEHEVQYVVVCMYSMSLFTLAFYKSYFIIIVIVIVIRTIIRLLLSIQHSAGPGN